MIYQRIRDICKAKGLTITGVERELGFAKGSLSKIDKNNPSSERIQKLSSYLGVSTKYLLTGEEDDGYYYDEETAQIAQEIFDNKELGLLMSASRGMSPDELKALTKFVQSMIQKEGGDTDS